MHGETISDFRIKFNRGCGVLVCLGVPAPPGPRRLHEAPPAGGAPVLPPPLVPTHVHPQRILLHESFATILALEGFDTPVLSFMLGAVGVVAELFLTTFSAAMRCFACVQGHVIGVALPQPKLLSTFLADKGLVSVLRSFVCFQSEL